MLAHFSHFFALVAHFFDFLARLKPSCVFLSIFFDFGWIFRGFGRVWDGFWDDFSMNFGDVVDTGETAWRATKHCVGA